MKKILVILFLLVLNTACSHIVNNNIGESKVSEKYLKEGVMLFLNGNNKSALRVLNKGLEKNKSKDIYYLLYHKAIAKIYFSSKKVNKGLYHLNKIFQHQEIKNKDELALISASYFAKSEIFRKQKKYRQALKILKKSLEIIKRYQASKKEKKTKDTLLSLTCHHIANIFFDNKEYRQSIYYYKKSLQNSKHKNAIYKALIITFNKIIDKNNHIYSGLEEAQMISDSFEFQESIKLYYKASVKIENNQFKESLPYIDKAIFNLNKVIEVKDKVRVKKLLTYLNQLKGKVYLNLSKKNYKAYPFYEKAYLYSESIKNLKTTLNTYSNKYSYFKFKTNEQFALKYYYEELYPKAYIYARKIFNYSLKNYNHKKNHKALLSYVEKMINTKTKYQTNNMSYLNLISLVLSINYHYQNSLLTSEKESEEISKKSLTQWINFKGIDYINDYKETVNHLNISRFLSKHQLYIDIVSGSQNYYIFTLDNNNNVTFEKISKKDTALINKNIQYFTKNNKKFSKAIHTETLSVNLEKNLKRGTNEALSIISKVIIDNYLSKQLKNKKELIISPDGLLNLLPFEALYHNGKYLIEDYKISYILSGREFVRQTKGCNLKIT